MAKDLTDVELFDILPPPLQGDEGTVEIAQAIDPHLQAVSSLSLELPILSRIDELPEEWLDLLAWQWHADKYDLDLTLDEKRALVKRLLIIHRYKGTLYAVKTALEPFEYEVEINEYTDYHHIFDVTIAPLGDGSSLADVYARAMEYINSAKAVTRHVGTFTLQISAPDTGIYFGIAPQVAEWVTVYPTTLITPETATEYIGVGVMTDIETVLEAAN